jgi:hypothetical protein
MTDQERRPRPEHHVVHDYANLVTSGKLIMDAHTNAALAQIGGANGHVWHAFYLNCRKMYEFFQYGPHEKYLRARTFLAVDVAFPFLNWNNTVQAFMETHMLHVGAGRLTNQFITDGSNDPSYLADFEGAWTLLMGNLKDAHKGVFRDEIDHRLTNPAFSMCGTLGREFII